MSLTLRKLLQNPSLDLRIVTSGHDQTVDEDTALDREFEWLHATDMINPIPFLGPAEVILTLGWQFPVVESADPGVPEVRVAQERLDRIYDEYAALVSAHGVIGIGFGSDVVHRGVPRGLSEACKKHSLILFDVPYEISFMDLLQEAARVLQRDQSERYTRSLRAQKAIATAATRRDGLTATLNETARQLGCGVALFDAVGQPITVVASPGTAPAESGDLAAIAQNVLRSGQRFLSVQASPETEAIVQVLGEPAEPRGVLILTLSQGFDDVSRNVLASVLALVSVSLEQNQALRDVHRSLREALLRLLLAGNTGAAEQISEKVWGPLPDGPLAVLICIPQDFDATRFLQALEMVHVEHEIPFFFAPYRSDVAVLVSEDSVEQFMTRTRDFNLIVGRSQPGDWNQLELLLDQATKAAQHGLRQSRAGVTEFGSMWRNGMADLIDASEAAHVARRVLSPLILHDERDNGQLIETVRVWLACNGKLRAAAEVLGIHRQTLARRLEHVSLVTGLNLDDHEDRAELSLALKFYRK